MSRELPSGLTAGLTGGKSERRARRPPGGGRPCDPLSRNRSRGPSTRSTRRRIGRRSVRKLAPDAGRVRAARAHPRASRWREVLVRRDAQTPDTRWPADPRGSLICVGAENASGGAWHSARRSWIGGLAAVVSGTRREPRKLRRRLHRRMPQMPIARRPTQARRARYRLRTRRAAIREPGSVRQVAGDGEGRERGCRNLAARS